MKDQTGETAPDKKEPASRTIGIALITSLLISGVSGFFTSWRTFDQQEFRIKALEEKVNVQAGDIATLRAAQNKQQEVIVKTLADLNATVKIIRNDVQRVEKNLEAMRRKR